MLNHYLKIACPRLARALSEMAWKNWNLKIALFALGFFFCANNASAAIIKPVNNLGLVGYWPLDEGVGTVAHDFSGQGNNGNFVGSTAWTSGKRGKAIVTSDSPGSYVLVGDKPSLRINSAGTVSAWIKSTNFSCDGSSYCGVIDKYNGNSDINGYSLTITAGTPELFVGDNSGFQTISSSVPISLNTWNHVAASWNGSRARVYVNGVKTQDVVQTSPVFDAGMSFAIGNNVLFGGRFNGTIDEARAYNRELSLDEVFNLYKTGSATVGKTNVGTDSLSQGLVGWWTFDGKDMFPKIMDRSVYGNHASIYRYVDTLGTIIPSATTTIAGKLGQAYQFSPPSVLNDEVFMLASSTPSLQFGGDFSVSFWIKAKGLNSTYQTGIISKSDFNAKNGWAFVDDGQWNPQVLFRVLGSGHYYDTYVDRSSVNDDKWHNIIGIHIGNRIHAYIDGVETNPSTILIDGNGGYDAGTNPVSFTPETVSDLLIGDTFNPNPASYAIDDVRVYNRALSQSEIIKLNQGNTVTKKNISNNGLVGWWPLDEGAGTLAHDFSGKSKNGQVVGGPTWASGRRGKALTFNGGGHMINLGDNFDYPGQPFSVCAWTYTTDDTTDGYIFGKFDGSNGFWMRRFSQTPPTIGTWQADVGINNNLTLVDGAPINTWVHLCAVMIPSPGTSTFYINGRAGATSTSVSGTPDTSVSATIGNRYDSARPYAGKIDDVRVYSRALTADEVKKLYEGAN